MTEIRVAHRDIVNDLSGLNDFGKERAAAALFKADADGNLRVDHNELLAAIGYVYRDPQITEADMLLVSDELQGAFTHLGSPATCEVGLPHEFLVENLTGLNRFGQQRAARGLFLADEDADLCVTNHEFRAALHAIHHDPALGQVDRNSVANNLQAVYTKLATPTGRTGVSLRGDAPRT